jgi:uncharacterized protein DUF6011
MITRTGHTCRLCGRPLTDATSRAFRIGPECRRDMTPDQLRASLQVAKEEAAPGYIPPDRPASPQARHNNAQARAVVETASTPQRATCVHGGMPGACPTCRYEADPNNAAARIIREIQGERIAARDAAWRAWHAAHTVQPAEEAS